MESFDYISPAYIIRDISESVNDAEFKSGLTRGWYMTQIKSCLDKFAYQTYFDKQTADFKIGTGEAIDPTILQLELPKGIYNIEEIYVWNSKSTNTAPSQLCDYFYDFTTYTIPYTLTLYIEGQAATIATITNQNSLDSLFSGYGFEKINDTQYKIIGSAAKYGDIKLVSLSDSFAPATITVLQSNCQQTGLNNPEQDCCSPNNSQPVYWKRQFNNMPNGGTGYTANRKNSNLGLDPFQPNYLSYTYMWSGDILWFNVQDGVMMFSPACAGWNYVRIVYSGTAGAIGDAPIIPRYFEEAFRDFVILRFCEAMMHRGRKEYAPMFDRKKDDLYGRQGSWYECANRVKRMTSKQRSDLKLYISHGNW